MPAPKPERFDALKFCASAELKPPLPTTFRPPADLRQAGLLEGSGCREDDGAARARPLPGLTFTGVPPSAMAPATSAVAGSPVPAGRRADQDTIKQQPRARVHQPVMVAVSG